MELLEALHARRNIRDYRPDPVPEEVVLKIIDAARFAPSGANWNPWRFLVTTDKTALARLGETAKSCAWMANPPAGIVVMADKASSRYWLEDCSAAVYAMWLAAVDMGLAMAWAAVYQSDNEEESRRRQNHVRRIFAVPDNMMIPMVLAVGYPDPDNPLPERKRPEVSDIVCWERYPEDRV